MENKIKYEIQLYRLL